MSPLELDTLRARVVAVTGHRPDKLSGYEHAAKLRLQQVAERVLEEARPRSIITGMALGWDQAVAVAAGRCGIPYIAAVPFKGQHEQWPFFAREEYERLLRYAYRVVYVSEPGYAVWKMQRRNEWMVDQCEAVLALWDGSGGGTANCIQYAAKVQRPMVNVWDQYQQQERVG